MSVMSSGYSSGYGHCWIEQSGSLYTVYIMNGKERRGPYSSFEAALTELRRYVL